MTTTDLDVRRLLPAQQHPPIFECLESMTVGDVLRITSDHDPEPVRCRLEVEHPGEFRWAVVDGWPDRWVIEITARAHVVDARPILAGGGEPFDMIMDAAARVADGEVLVVRAPFEPVPLQGVLAEQGFGYISDELADGDWRTTFVRS